MLAGLGRSLLLAGGGVTGGLGIVAAVYGPGDLVDGVRAKLALAPPAITAPEKPDWGERNLDLGRALEPPDPQAPPADRKANLPSLDIVRVEPSGDAVIAGRGAPNATVEILRDNKPYASGVADEAGQFAIVPPALPAGNSELTYRTTGADGQAVMGGENIVVVVPDKPDTRPLVAVGTPDRPTEVLSQPGAPAETAVAELKRPEAKPDAPRAAAKPDAAKSAAKEAPKEAVKPPERVAALPEAPPKANTPAQKKADLKIVSVDAQEGGRLDVSGRAGAWSTLRLYLNDTLVATGRAGPDGRIAFTIGRGVSPGGYQIRIDQVDPGSGKVAHRAQVSFAFPESAPAKVAARDEPAPPKPEAITRPEAAAKPAPPPIPERPKAETGPKPAETAARIAAAPPSAPALEARAASRQPDPSPKPPASAQKVAEAGAPPKSDEAATRPERPAAPDARPVARLAEAPSGLTTTWVQPSRQPAAEPAGRPMAETPAFASAARPEPSRPSLDADRRAADALAPALPPAARPAQAEPRQAMAPSSVTPTPGPRAEAGASGPEQGLSVTPPGPASPGPSMSESGQPGAVFVPEISTAKITRGDSLWVISKRTYGKGLRYTVIFDANQDQIKDPHLIYPGQIFVLPKDSPLGDQGAKRG